MPTTTTNDVTNNVVKCEPGSDVITTWGGSGHVVGDEREKVEKDSNPEVGTQFVGSNPDTDGAVEVGVTKVGVTTTEGGGGEGRVIVYEMAAATGDQGGEGGEMKNKFYMTQDGSVFNL